MSFFATIHHASMLTEDLARAKAFYEGVLGLTPNPSRPNFEYDGVWYDVGTTQIHLIALPNPDAGAVRPAHGGRDRHVALIVKDWEGLVAALEQAKVHFTLSRSGRKALFCRDPDDNALEMIGFVP